ncbi:MAG: DEAD/DEAH box helicase family protein [Treponema sp.]|nr:DEAD/DEAH box helicase family protein [Treponema sp.]
MEKGEIKFKGEFRNYQKRILDNSEKYLSDKKLNIVAAPGSGKTILGLDFISRLNAPCLILSPTTTIRDQWGIRFKESFLPENKNLDDYFSCNLNKPAFINSITYQALYSSVNKIVINEEDETDFSDIDIFSLIKKVGIKTICLDEAHHLQNEWQKALEKFISLLDEDIVIISLTATPPYDATPAEWERYNKLCGEIDDEIFVPELVKEGTLCPHQDYVYFNYPSNQELKEIKQQKELNVKALEELSSLPFLENIVSKIEYIYKNDEEYFYKNYIQCLRCLIFLAQCKKPKAVKVFKRITKHHVMPHFNFERCQSAIQFILDSEQICNNEEKRVIKNILEQNSALDRGKVCFTLNDRLKRKIVSSVGKLKSISEIVNAEYKALNSKLRLLILTDYIKKETIKNIGTDKPIDNISVVSIFNELLKNNQIKTGVLSGALVILPSEVAVMLKERNIKVTSEEIKNTDYSVFSFSSTNKTKVNVVSELFEKGYINVLIGTQALLGEGWDAPCINSLILASFVGSFMLSNQMRGRAIRSYKNDINKTANIWHLVTIEPQFKSENFNIVSFDDENESSDYKTLVRRFECFVGPSYSEDKIQNGIERLSIIKPPFNKDNIQLINKKMLEISSRREELAQTWNKVLENSSRVYITNEIPRNFKVPAFTFVNLFPFLLSTGIELIIIRTILQSGKTSLMSIFILFISALVYSAFIKDKLFHLTKHFSPKKSIKSMSNAVLNIMIKLNLINSDVRLNVLSDTNDIYIRPQLSNATIHEQNIFNTAMQEMLSPIDNPKYIIVRKSAGAFFKDYDFSVSFACPSIIYKTKDSKKIIEQEVKREMGNMDVIFCYNENGRKMMNKARQNSFISKYNQTIKKRQKV